MRWTRRVAQIGLLGLVIFGGGGGVAGIGPDGSAHPARDTTRPVPNLTIFIGPVEVIRGPDDDTDNPFVTVADADGLDAYLANATTVHYRGGSLETLRPMPAFALGPGTTVDTCGAWLNAAWRDGDLVRGIYHAETACDYSQGITHKSAAYAVSTTDGATFTKQFSPTNQVLAAPPSYPTPGQDDEGDHAVIQVGDYRYMYFLSSHDWRIHLARAHVSTDGRPGAWQKYEHGAFAAPQLDGPSSPLADWSVLSNSWVSYSRYLGRYLGFSGKATQADGYRGRGFAVSDDGITWTALPSLILPSKEEWNRTSTSGELTAYPSLISLYGDSQHLDNSFWLYSMYLNPGDTFATRYLVRRRITMQTTTSTAATDVTPRIALTTYRSAGEIWDTTTTTDAAYSADGTVGSLFTEPVPNAIPVYDCLITAWGDHMLVPNDATCAGNRMLRQAGWIATTPFAGAVQIYRCYDAARHDHFVSTSPACGGATLEWSMGYLAPPVTPPAAPYVALSGYNQQSPVDHWTTTVPVSATYVFDQRWGYIFTTAQPNSLPLYDCYIADWDDHMLVPGDASCAGAQNLGRLGWIATQPFPGAVPIYRCYDQATTNHVVSRSADCGGIDGEWRIGYVARTPSPSVSVYLPLLTGQASAGACSSEALNPQDDVAATLQDGVWYVIEAYDTINAAPPMHEFAAERGPATVIATAASGQRAWPCPNAATAYAEATRGAASYVQAHANEQVYGPDGRRVHHP